MEAVKTCVLIFALLLAGGVCADEWQVPRMPWGDPDLQGIWTNATITTLSRPDEIDELVLSEAQAAALEREGEEALAKIDDLPEGDLKAGDSVGGYNAFWVDPGTRVLRVRGEPRSSIIVEPEDGDIPYTLWGRARFYWNGYKMLNWHNNPEERPLGERCTVGFGSTGGPPMLPVLYNNNYQIAQTEDHVFILVEMNHNVRTIRLDAEPLPAAVRPWLGDSIGHWEGDTLVVRTTQFHPQQNLRAAIKHQFYMTEDSVVEERFTRINENEILYQFTVTDDSIYRRPWRGELTLRATEGPIYEYACHEGNYALPNILSGARQEERN
ncbi:MAG: hypothetical protein U5K56_16760 [Halioglobus sp.]|nr:hypothetical protein [Halioglobus sp.]